MSRKEDRLWSEGFARACRIAREKGLDGLFDEERFRNITGFKGRLTSSDLDSYDSDVKELIFQMVRITFVAILHDAFGFGEKRLKKFVEMTDKFAQYSQKGWLYWADVIDEIREKTGIDMSIVEGETRLNTYKRPENADLYEEPDLIDDRAWRARLKELGLTDNGECVSDKTGTLQWRYKTNFDKIQIYDELTGILWATEFLGARKPGETK